MVSLEDVERLDLRVGEIVAAEAVPGTQKLLRLTVDLGGECRTLVGGLAESYRPEELRGLQVVVVANLEPATIRGITSQGMLLGVGCEEPGHVAVVTVQRPVPNGAAVR